MKLIPCAVPNGWPGATAGDAERGGPGPPVLVSARAVPYPLLCTLLGLVAGWLPKLVHGPIPEKFDILYIRGAIAVWAFYGARLMIGFMVGITCWPARWYLRGPMCGFLLMLPVGVVALATPGCQFQ